MAKKRKKELSMRKIREVLRLGMQGQMGHREIARSCMISHTTVGDYLSRAEQAGLTYAQIETMEDGKLTRLLKGEKPAIARSSRPQPDWVSIHQELKKKGVTLQLLWQEYKEEYPAGYQLSQFYELYHRWNKKLQVTLRHTHKAGEKLFVDYAGHTIPVRDPLRGNVKQAQVFVAVLGASNYTYVEATWSQRLADWIGSHVRAFEFFGGVPHMIVPDNLKAGVSKACRYEPDMTPTYHDMAVHYGTVIIPARVRKPRDKAKVEVGVQVVERWILAALRNRTFFHVHELNEAIWNLVDCLNRRPFKKLPGSRLSWFETMERDVLLPLPQGRYVFAEWKKARVNIDYHVELERHYYSVPYSLVQEVVDIRFTATVVEMFFRGKRVASHRRNDQPGQHSTHKEHMPKHHQQYVDWSPSRMIRWAGTIGEATAQVVETILNTRKYPEQGYRSCLGILRLGKHYSNDRLEAACRRAIAIGSYRYKSIRSILENGLDRVPLASQIGEPPIEHRNIRGGRYYN